MAGQARDLRMRAEGESSVIITAGACLVPARPYWRRHLATGAGAAGPWLPDELQVAVDAGSPTCQPFDADEFVGRVAERAGVQPQVAWTQVRAVLGTLDREVAEMKVLRQRLPREFGALMA